MLSCAPIDLRLLDGFLDDCDAVRETKRVYRYEIELFGRYLESRQIPLEAATRDDVILFSRWMQALYSPGFVNHALSSLERFYRWLDAEHGIDDVAKGIPRAPASVMPKRKGLTAEQANWILRASEAADDERMRARDSALVHLALLAAMVPREIVSANVGDVSFSPDGGVIKVPGSKGRPASTVFLTGRVASALMRHLSFREGAEKDDPMFTSLSSRTFGKRLAPRSLREIFQRIFERSGVPGTAGDYSMTLTAVLMAMEGGASAREVRELARVRCMYSERRYELAYMERAESPQEKAQRALEESASEERSAVVSAGKLRRMLDGVGDEQDVVVSVSRDGSLSVVPSPTKASDVFP